MYLSDGGHATWNFDVERSISKTKRIIRIQRIFLIGPLQVHALYILEQIVYSCLKRHRIPWWFLQKLTFVSSCFTGSSQHFSIITSKEQLLISHCRRKWHFFYFYSKCKWLMQYIYLDGKQFLMLQALRKFENWLEIIPFTNSVHVVINKSEKSARKIFRPNKSRTSVPSHNV